MKLALHIKRYPNYITVYSEGLGPFLLLIAGLLQIQKYVIFNQFSAKSSSVYAKSMKAIQFISAVGHN